MSSHESKTRSGQVFRARAAETPEGEEVPQGSLGLPPPDLPLRDVEENDGEAEKHEEQEPEDEPMLVDKEDNQEEETGEQAMLAPEEEAQVSPASPALRRRKFEDDAVVIKKKVIDLERELALQREENLFLKGENKAFEKIISKMIDHSFRLGPNGPAPSAEEEISVPAPTPTIEDEVQQAAHEPEEQVQEDQQELIRRIVLEEAGKNIPAVVQHYVQAEVQAQAPPAFAMPMPAVGYVNPLLAAFFASQNLKSSQNQQQNQNQQQ